MAQCGIHVMMAPVDMLAQPRTERHQFLLPRWLVWLVVGHDGRLSRELF